MKMKAVFLCVLTLFAISLPSSCGENVTVSIKSVTTIGRTDESFICATIDWWPPEKCNYDWCPWGNASVLNLDLKNPILHHALRAFNTSGKPPLRIRIGGSLQDQVIYRVGTNHPKCQNFRLSKGKLFDFTEGCLTMCRWNKVNELFQKTRVVVTFGLNALIGRKNTQGTLYEGQWDSSNARDFINYTASKKYNVDSWEFGNELAGDGVSAKVSAKDYGENLIALKAIIDDIYGDSQTKPKLLAPGGFFDEQWFGEMLQYSGPNVVDAVTHHMYNLGPGNTGDLYLKMQDPFFLDNSVQTFQDVQTTIRNFGPWSSAWVGESGGAYNSGGPESHTYLDSFWYLDQLGMAATYSHKAYCRQALIGGNYGLLNTTTFVPNPDYYSALLWHRLMGTGVLHATHNGSPYLRMYAHCSQDYAGFTLLMINLSNSTAFDVSIANDMNLYPAAMYRYATMAMQPQGKREDYYLTPKDGNIRSQVMLLNGRPLDASSTGEIPEMYPIISDASAPLHIAPSSIAFVRFKEVNIPACPN